MEDARPEHGVPGTTVSPAAWSCPDPTFQLAGRRSGRRRSGHGRYPGHRVSVRRLPTTAGLRDRLLDVEARSQWDGLERGRGEDADHGNGGRHEASTARPAAVPAGACAWSPARDGRPGAGGTPG